MRGIASPGSIALAVVACAWCVPVFGQQKTPTVLQQAATGALKPATVPISTPAGPATRTLPFFSAGLLNAAGEAMGKQTAQAPTVGSASSSNPPSADLSMGRGTVGCGARDGAGPNNGENNVRVNQDCSFRRQAEEKMAFNPVKPTNLVGGMNDSRVGFNQCGIAWSTDDGAHWGDLLPPFRQRLNDPQSLATGPNHHTITGMPGTFHTYDAASDPAPAFDSQGRAFFTCVAFDVASNAYMVFATQSPVGAQGSFFLNLTNANANFVVVEDNDPNIAHDKPFTTADTYPQSSRHDNVYVTWTVFQVGPNGCCSSPIYGSMSTDHGLTFSTPEEISGSSTTLCFFGNFFDPSRSPNSCDFDQGSDPAVLPNGDLVVVFNNGNTPANDPNGQQLTVHCSPSGSSPAGTAHLNCGVPKKVGDDVIVGEPLCDLGRGPEPCIPGPFIRTNDFPRIGVNRANGHIYVAWQDYRNGEYDIQLARSTDGGATWSASTKVNPDSGLDHYFAAIDLASNAFKDRVGVSYFRSQKTPGTGLSDYVLAGGTGLASPFQFDVLSPVFAPPDGVQAGFNGDYSGLVINQDEEAHPIWSDTRNSDPFAPANGVVHDEDVFTAKANLPDGVAKPSVGQVGKR
jgi:hypothetical protein